MIAIAAQAADLGGLSVAAVVATGPTRGAIFAVPTLAVPVAGPTPDAGATPVSGAKPPTADQAPAIAEAAPLVVEPVCTIKTIHPALLARSAWGHIDGGHDAEAAAPQRPSRRVSARLFVAVAKRERADPPLPVAVAAIVPVPPAVPPSPAGPLSNSLVAERTTDGLPERDQHVALTPAATMSSAERDHLVLPAITVAPPVEPMIGDHDAEQPVVSPARVDPAGTDAPPFGALSVDPRPMPQPRRAPALPLESVSPSAPSDVEDVAQRPVPPIATRRASAEVSVGPRQGISGPIVEISAPPAAPDARGTDVATQPLPPVLHRVDLPLPMIAAHALCSTPPTMPAVGQPPLAASHSITTRPAAFAVDTPSLGAVGAEVTHRGRSSGDVLHVHFAVERSGTAALIAGASNDLGRALAATGSRLDGVTVEVRAGAGDAPARGGEMAAGDSGVGNSGARGDDAHRQPPAPRQPVPPPFRTPPFKPVVRDRFA